MAPDASSTWVAAVANSPSLSLNTSPKLSASTPSPNARRSRPTSNRGRSWGHLPSLRDDRGRGGADRADHRAGPSTPTPPDRPPTTTQRNTTMATDIDLTSFKALSFDCYGTLIDWEAGIAAVLAPWAREQRTRPDRRRAAARLRRQRGGRRAGHPCGALPGGARQRLPPDWRQARSPGQRGVGAAAGQLGTGLAGVPRLRGRPGPAG